VHDRLLDDRRIALEEAFFRKESARLRERMRAASRSPAK
jgi:hypothetical protein